MYRLKNPEGLKGTVSNLNAFIHRDLDTGFSTKWSGIWKPGHKLLDYYAYRVNGIWLDSDNLKAVDYGETITYYFETGSLHIEEKITAPEGLSGVKSSLKIENKLEEKKAVQVALEAGIDIREKSTDIPENNYKVERNKSRVKISRDKSVKITSNQELINAGEPYLKEHFPGERQECIVPGEITARIELDPSETRKIEFNFTSSEASDYRVGDHDNYLEGNMKRSFEASVQSIENLLYDRDGLGIIAGHPWFQNYWARDSFWSVLGLIDAGYFEEVEKILEIFAEKELPGKIKLDGEDEERCRSDTYPLYIIAADKLRRHYGITSKIEEGMEEAFEQLETENGLVKHDSKGTWMDTLKRPKAVDVQSLWLKAAEIMGRREKELRDGLEKFAEEEYIMDHLGENPAHTINPAVPLMFDHFNSGLSKINAEFSSRFGARTRSVTDPGYNSSGYHTGSTWGLTTCWAAAANFQHGKTVEGLNFLENFSGFLDEGQPGALPEVVDSENGENLGCIEQAWSAGMFVHVIDSYLLGIKVGEDEIKIEPCESYSGKRLNKRVGESYLDIKVEDGEAEILNNPDLEKEVLI